MLRPLLGFLAVPQIVRLLSNAKSAAYVPNHRCQLHCIIQSQFVATEQHIATHCLPTSIESREIYLKHARASGTLNPEPFALAAECITTRLPRPKKNCASWLWPTFWRNKIWNVNISEMTRAGAKMCCTTFIDFDICHYECYTPWPTFQGRIF